MYQAGKPSQAGSAPILASVSMTLLTTAHEGEGGGGGVCVCVSEEVQLGVDYFMYKTFQLWKHHDRFVHCGCDMIMAGLFAMCRK